MLTKVLFSIKYQVELITEDMDDDGKSDQRS